MSYYKPLLIAIGTLSLGIGIIGIIVPILPTTPFLLITASLYVRSSDRLYQKLMESKHLGPYLHNFHSEKGINRKTKVYSITTMWLMIIISAVFLLDSGISRLIILILGVIGTIVMAFLVPTTGSKK